MTIVARYVALILFTFHCISLTELFTLVAVTRKVIVNNNYKYVNVTSTNNKIGPITNHSLDVDIQLLREIRDIKLVAVPRKVVIYNNYKYVNVTANINEIGPVTNHTVDADIQFLKPIRNIKLTVQYHLVLNHSIVPNAFVSRTVDVCHFLRRPTSDRLLNLMYSQFKKNSHLPVDCPIQPEYYYIREFRPSTIAIPGFLPENDFLLKEIFFGLNNRPLFTYQFYGSFVRMASK